MQPGGGDRGRRWRRAIGSAALLIAALLLIGLLGSALLYGCSTT